MFTSLRSIAVMDVLVYLKNEITEKLKRIKLHRALLLHSNQNNIFLKCLVLSCQNLQHLELG